MFKTAVNAPNMARHADITHVNERRLRPIYDCLDNGNNKKALQEAEKVLKKQKELQCAKVLKALALLRLGRQTESHTILHEVHRECPTDDATLQAMTICYRELHKLELIADAYESASKKEPTNEELHSHLFMAYVRMGEYKKQQIAAMNLYRLKPKNPYYFWAVMSVYMQAISAKDQNMALKVHLPIAEKMCYKFIDENKIEAEAEVELFLMILERQEKYEEMLKTIDGSLGDKLGNHIDFLSRRKAQILLLMRRHKDAFESYRSLIENNLDQLEYYIEMYHIATYLDETISNCTDESLNNGTKHQSYHYMTLFIKFIDKCIEKMNREANRTKSSNRSFQRLRGPYIARMEVFVKIKTREQMKGDAEQLLKRFPNSITDLLIEYYEHFGSKFTCIYDMFYVFAKYKLTDDDINLLLTTIKQGLQNLSDRKPQNVLQRNLCFYFISLYLGQYDALPNDEESKLLAKLIEEYDSFHADLPIGDELITIESADPYIHLIGQILFKLKAEFDDNTVFQLIVIIERALNKNQSNYYLKLYLLKLYNAIGAVSSSHGLLESLDIKYIQYDSLGYIISTPLINGGHFVMASQALGIALRFYSANYKDTLDYLITCYKYGSFNKIEEIIHLRERLNNSLQYCSVAVERMFLDLILETKDHSSTENIINYMEIDPEKDKFIWNNLRDNRDFSVFRSYHSQTERVIEAKKKQTFNDDILWLKYRNLLIRVIAAAHYCTISKSEGTQSVCAQYTNGSETRNPIDVLNDLTLHFRECINTINCSNVVDSFLPIEGPQPSRLCLYSKRSHMKVLLSLFEFISALHNDPKDINDVLIAVELFTTLVNDIEAIVANTKSLFLLRSSLEELTDCIETLSICVILIGTGQSVMKTKMNISNKKNKKKKETIGGDNVIVDSIIETYNTLLNGFSDAANKIDVILKSINVETLTAHHVTLNFPVNSTYLIEENGFNETLAMVKENISKSYRQSLKELNDLLQNKMKYILSIKF